MKKTVCLILFLSILVTSVSSDPISLGFGNLLRHRESIYDGIPEDTLFDPPSYRFGAEARFQLFFVETTMNGVFGDNNHWLDGMITLGIRTPFLGIFDIGLGFGPYYGMSFTDGEALTFIHFIHDEYPESWYYRVVDTFGEVFTDSVMGYRLHVDAHLGKISVGVAVDAPTVGYTFANNDSELLGPNMEKARAGVTALFWLF